MGEIPVGVVRYHVGGNRDRVVRVGIGQEGIFVTKADPNGAGHLANPDECATKALVRLREEINVQA